jgi:hypothetical protein
MYIKLPSKHRSPDLATAMKYSIPIPLLKPRPSTQQHLLPLMRQDSSFTYKNYKTIKKNYCTFLQQEKITAPSYSKKKITAPSCSKKKLLHPTTITTLQRPIKISQQHKKTL